MSSNFTGFNEGEVIVSNEGMRGVIVEIIKLYPTHSRSPARSFIIDWIDTPPKWTRSGVPVSAFAVRKVTPVRNQFSK